MLRSRATSALLCSAGALCTALLFGVAPPARAIDSAGLEFWIADTPELAGTSLAGSFALVVSNPCATDAYVTITPPGAPSVSVTIAPGASHRETGPNLTMYCTGSVAAVPPVVPDCATADNPSGAPVWHVTSDVPVVVMAHHAYNGNGFSNDSTLAIPLHELGLRYRIGSWFEMSQPYCGAFITIVGTCDDTAATIIDENGDVRLTRNLDAGEYVAYIAGRDGARLDPTGWLVLATRPVVVQAGSVSTFITDSPAILGQGDSDQISEAIPPQHALGTEFLAIPSLTRPMVGCASCKPDVFRVVPTVAGTALSITTNPDCPPTAGTWEPGQVWQCATDAPFVISASEPVAVYNYLVSWASQWPMGPFDGETGDPSMGRLLAPSEFKDRYIVHVPEDSTHLPPPFADYLYGAARDGAVLTITPPGATFTTTCHAGVEPLIYGPGLDSYCSFRYQIPEPNGDGTYVVTSTEPFALYLLGQADNRSYLLPAGGCDYTAPQPCVPSVISSVSGALADLVLNCVDGTVSAGRLVDTPEVADVQAWLDTVICGPSDCLDCYVTNDWTSQAIPVRCNVAGTEGLDVTFTAHGAPGCVETAVTRKIVMLDVTDPTVACTDPPPIACTDGYGINLADPLLASWRDSLGSDGCSAVTRDFSYDPSPVEVSPDVFYLQACSTGVTVTVTDACGHHASCHATVTMADATGPSVVIDNPPPQNPLCLWPPNHKYVEFENLEGIFTVTDACGVASVEITCSSDQCDDAPPDVSNPAPDCMPGDHAGENGDGNTGNDCYWDRSTRRLRVRSERAGTEPEGRTYTVKVMATDRCGTMTTGELFKIHVPHDQRDVAERDCISPNATPLVDAGAW